MAFSENNKNIQKKNNPKRERSILGLSRRIGNCYKRVFSIDFEESLSLKDQLIILITILFISAAFFAFVYLGSFVVSCNNNSSGQQAAAGVSLEETEMPLERSGLSEEHKKSEISMQTDNSDNQESSKERHSSEESDNSQKSEPSKENISDVSSDKSEDSFYFRNIKKVSKSGEMIHYGSLILVNKDIPCYYDGENTVPITEQPTEKYDVTDFNVSLDKQAADSLNEMLDDFYALYGDTDLMIACGYRSFETQVRLYNDEIENVGEEDAVKWVAPPGFSEHQTGYSFDLNLNIPEQGGIRYEGTGIYSWINDNCADYGFIIRYPKGREDITGYEYEPWHFRYVGKAEARYISQNGMTLEEYLDNVHSASPKKPLILSENEGIYTYFVSAELYGETKIPVPSDNIYDISGNNYDGFIVTVYNIPAENENEDISEVPSDDSEE